MRLIAIEFFLEVRFVRRTNKQIEFLMFVVTSACNLVYFFHTSSIHFLQFFPELYIFFIFISEFELLRRID